MTIEHLIPENPAKPSGPSGEEVASIGNLILTTEKLNNKLANKTFTEKKAILRSAKVWVDDVILNSQDWGSAEIQQRAKLLAGEAFNNIWKL